MQVLDAASVRAWCALALEALGRGREEIDAVNVFPVADGDTGTNLYLTVESAAQAVDAVYGAFAAEDAGAGGGVEPAVADVLRAMAHGALIGARGNSGTILAELLRGLTGAVPQAGARAGAGGGAGELLAVALRRGADAARAAVEHPVEGTMLTVADAAAAAAVAAVTEEETGGPAGDAARVARGAYDGAREALAATTGQLEVLRRAGVVDAGGLGLVAVLGTLADALSGAARPTELGPEGPAGRGPGTRRTAARHDGSACAEPGGGGPAYEVIYLLEAGDAAVTRLRPRLDALGDSLVVVGGDGLWRVHVHVDDAGAAVEAGVEAGRPYRIRITHLPAGPAPGAPPSVKSGDGGPEGRAVVAVVPGDGLAALCAQAGAGVVTVREGEPPASGELAEAMRRTGAGEVVLLPNDAELRHTAAVAVEEARASGVRAALIPTRAAVQGLAALAVHDPRRRFDEDVVSMTAAAGATRHAELAVAEQEAWTTAGICRPGDVLGVVEGDVAVVGADLAETAEAVLDRMLAGGGELVTLVLGPDLPEGFGARLEAHVRGGHLAVDTVVYDGGSQSAPLLIGVE
ncbi:DAK2 domain-containing protein [Streptomyces sp. WMMC500]|uniref:DAK2 domain-containing protein n=1 Tax=Streptomyces sp. WMMC500 TaxID=3015154 RepID=UPI00248AE6B3|nr:DAK2 domain-containing protein [Streptomyces sp. WMMC500]WBB62814.1 DAK2 domain-containing protein [Streptomyces sp. WMMC500]